MSIQSAKDSSPPDTTGRIAGIEVVSYTAVIILIGTVAAGWFDAMVPWK